MTDDLILVDEHDKQIGTAEKMRVHEKGLLHRAFSILVLNSKNEILLQQRAKSKYHCGGLWTNTCCSHPRNGELLDAATHRRLKEEMGFDCELKKTANFIYKVKFANGLTEHEHLHVFTGLFDGKCSPNPEEADDCKWISQEELRKDVEKNPEKYTYWFSLILEKLNQPIQP